ncbi:MAG: hypothetical protein ABI311_13955 [Gemmatimonadaceae bacterium]
MYAVIRRYSGVAKLISELDKRQAEVTAVLTGGPGFMSYYAVRDGEALATITVCNSREDAEESTRRAAAWIRDNLAGVRVTPPEAIGGDVFIHASK